MNPNHDQKGRFAEGHGQHAGTGAPAPAVKPFSKMTVKEYGDYRLHLKHKGLKFGLDPKRVK